MRGVPREREAISAAPSSVELDAEQAGGAVHDQVELGGLVELEVGGEAEPVAQRPGQQPGAGGGADQGERRDLQRDRGGARALADDDVDPEVLHRHVEHLLGRAATSGGSRRRRARRRRSCPDRIAARSPAWVIAGPLVSRSGVLISAAMIMARVVLPSPGGPESSTWSGARPRRRAASSTSPSWSRTRSWPMTSSRVRGRSAASTARSSPSASAAVRRAGGGRPRRRRARPSCRSVHAVRPCSGCGGRRAAGRRRRGRHRPRARPRRRPCSASLADQPRPTRPWCTWSRHGAAGRSAG